MTTLVPQEESRTNEALRVALGHCELAELTALRRLRDRVEATIAAHVAPAAFQLALHKIFYRAAMESAADFTAINILFEPSGALDIMVFAEASFAPELSYVLLCDYASETVVPVADHAGMREVLHAHPEIGRQVGHLAEARELVVEADTPSDGIVLVSVGG